MRRIQGNLLTAVLLWGLVVLAATLAMAAIFGVARGVVHDPQHRPIAGATVVLQAKSANLSQSAVSDDNGEFLFRDVPEGEYTITVRAPGFAASSRSVAVSAGSAPVLHLMLFPAGPSETVTVSGAPSPVAAGSPSTITVVDRQEIAATPGASRPNSLAMITDYVPGAYITHDQLHVRGGHQTSWLIDGVPIPNTNIASNLGPQFLPGDIDYLEVHRGAYGSEFGDRTYGVFNIVPRSGFERDREGELVLSAGNFYQTNDQLNFGSHTERFAYYASLNGNRSNLGIQTPVPQVVHDAENGYGGFTSLIFNHDPANQLRFVGSARRDFYQIPYDPFPNDVENSHINGQFPSIGLRDAQQESDVVLQTTWEHTFNPRWTLTLSPLYHYNSADYESSPNDYTYVPPDPTHIPDATSDQRGATYAGGQIVLDGNVPRNHLQAGMYSFYEQQNELFGVGGASGFTDQEHPTGRLVSMFFDDKLTVAPWLTLTGGIRPTFFDGGVSESVASPRVGAALTLPRLRWTLRGFYGHYYQAPPLITVSGTLLQFAGASSDTFRPLHGERDEEYEFGLGIPWRGWLLDADTFRTRVNNFFDHNNIGISNLFFPITIQSALIRAWELTLHSPRVAGRVQLHLAYSNQIAEGGGVVTGGLSPTGAAIQVCAAGVALCPLDHDQRNTLNVGGDVLLPWHSHAATNVYYGSGFTNGQRGAPYPGPYLPSHTTFDLSLGKDFGKSYSISVTALNVANRRVELDNSVTFGGFHWNEPRELYAQLTYRFHY